MIPDDPTFFNSFLLSIPKNFDDHETRLRYWLGQDAIPTVGGRHLLYACPLCRRPWYKAGKREYPRITHEQLAFLGEVLHTDTTYVRSLPEALCSICSATYLGGIFSVEEYRRDMQPQRQGYHFTWEGLSAPKSHLIGMICRRERLTTGTLLAMKPDTLATPMKDVRRVLTWIDALPFPDAVLAYTDEDRHVLSQRVHPAMDAAGIPRIWRGYTWIDDCPALEGEVLVSLAIALSPLAFHTCEGLLTSWKLLARAMQTIV